MSRARGMQEACKVYAHMGRHGVGCVTRAWRARSGRESGGGTWWLHSLDVWSLESRLWCVWPGAHHHGAPSWSCRPLSSVILSPRLSLAYTRARASAGGAAAGCRGPRVESSVQAHKSHGHVQHVHAHVHVHVRRTRSLGLTISVGILIVIDSWERGRSAKRTP